MTLTEFINRYEGKEIDYGGRSGAQCVDLYRQYAKEVLGYPQNPSVVGAKDIWNSYLTDYYERIPNTPTGVPEKGDVIIFGSTLGKYGHVSVFIEGNISRFTSLDQNYPKGSPCHRQGHTYAAVIGWLRPLKIEYEEDMPNWFETFLQERGLDLANDEGRIREIFDNAKRYEKNERRIEQLEKDFAGARGEAAEYKTRLQTVEQSRTRREAEIEEVRKSRSAREKEIGSLQDKI